MSLAPPPGYPASITQVFRTRSKRKGVEDVELLVNGRRITGRIVVAHAGTTANGYDIPRIVTTQFMYEGRHFFFHGDARLMGLRPIVEFNPEGI